MFKTLCMASALLAAMAQHVPDAVRAALRQKFPQAAHVSWEREKGNYEANWGGKSGEDHSAQFTPDGTFIEIVDAVDLSTLPASVATYVRGHYHTSIREAGRLTDAAGAQSYEVEIRGKDLLFSLDGTFIKEEA